MVIFNFAVEFWDSQYEAIFRRAEISGGAVVMSNIREAGWSIEVDSTESKTIVL